MKNRIPEPILKMILYLAAILVFVTLATFVHNRRSETLSEYAARRAEQTQQETTVP